MTIKFGSAGNPESFYQQGNKSSSQMPPWLKQQGLNAYEYQCGRGVRVGPKGAEEIGLAAEQNQVSLSIHAPYYINLASQEDRIIISSKEHILRSLRAARWMGAARVVFHPGAGKDDRVGALQRAKAALLPILDAIYSEGLEDIRLCPETMGKVNQLGSLEEVLELCAVAENIHPTVDFGHINAVTHGGLDSKEAFARVLDAIESKLGHDEIQNLHVHFSPIEFTKGGEKKHWTTLDTQFGPSFEPLAELLVQRKLTPTIICESDSRQAEDALVYKNIYLSKLALLES